MLSVASIFFFFFFNDAATTEIYTLSLHDALPISRRTAPRRRPCGARAWRRGVAGAPGSRSEEHTLNSSHGYISYAVFCLKKKKKKDAQTIIKNKTYNTINTNTNSTNYHNRSASTL